MSKLSFLKSINKNIALAVVAVVGIVIVAGLIALNQSGKINLSVLGIGMSNDQIAKKAVDYINNNQLAASTASYTAVSSESGLVKVKIKIGTSEFDSYVSKDGKFLFPTSFDMDEKKEGDQNTTTDPVDTKESCDSMTKTDSPQLEIYVVSRCPYGLQMQRAAADAVNSVPELAKYIRVLYMGAVSGNTITSMHGDEEAQENLRQICLREEQPTKYWPYVACQMKSGDTAGCEKSTGVDSAKLKSCTTTPSKGVAYAKKDFDLNDKYGVSGSPTLMMGGSDISETGFGGRSSDAVKTMICCASNNQPSFCSKTLNTAAAASSFSETYADSGAAPSSGSPSCGQ